MKIDTRTMPHDDPPHTLALTIRNSRFMYMGSAPSEEVSQVEIFAARIEQMATDILFMAGSSKNTNESKTSLAQW